MKNLLQVVGILCVSLAVGLSFCQLPVPRLLFVVGGGSYILNLILLCSERSLWAVVGRRVFDGCLSILVIASITFLLLRLLPGGPFDSEKVLPASVVKALEQKYHLDEPLYKQYFGYMVGLVRGDLGASYKFTGRGVSEVIAESLPISLQLGTYALILSFLVGVPLGVLAGWNRGTKLDQVCSFVAIAGVSAPSFVVAPLFIVVFVFWVPWFEAALWEGPASYVLPTVVLGLRPAALIMRLTRTSVLDAVHTDYVRTAKAKGLSSIAVLFRHALRNSLIPVLSLSGPLVANVLTGSFVVEQIFAIPGMAKHLILSVGNRDYPMILGVTLVFSVLLIVANIVFDLLIVAFDPRVRLE